MYISDVGKREDASRYKVRAFNEKKSRKPLAARVRIIIALLALHGSSSEQSALDPSTVQLGQ